MEKLLSRLEKVKRSIQIICELLELIAAVLVLIGILLSAISLVGNGDVFRQLMTNTASFKQYLDQIFMLVIGIEFLIMLCRPNSENVIDVIIFLVARHMIIGDTTPYQDFVSVISVAILCIVRRYLRVSKENKEEKKKEEQNNRIIEE